jgi:putative transposase
MEFEKGQLFHIYNRGNNRERIFFSRENYMFFLKKVKTYIQPYCDIVAWCLMPNHFHLMVFVKDTELEVFLTESFARSDNAGIEGFARSDNATIEGFARSETLDKKKRTLNQSIGIMLRSYTDAIKKQENRTGSLFQKQTKAIMLSEKNRHVPAYFNTVFGTLINTKEYRSYAETCFNYIHNNPCKAHLVVSNEEWEFSSYQDYLGLRNGKLVNKEMGKEYFNLLL